MAFRNLCARSCGTIIPLMSSLWRSQSESDLMSPVLWDKVVRMLHSTPSSTKVWVEGIAVTNVMPHNTIQNNMSSFKLFMVISSPELVIILKRIPAVAIYCMRWECRALYNNSNNMQGACMHTHTHTHTHMMGEEGGRQTCLPLRFWRTCNF